MRHDYGQYAYSLDGRKRDKCCAALCLSAATGLTPAQLLEFFTERTDMIAEINAFATKCPDAVRDWESYTDKDGFRHLCTATEFGSKDSWAANYAIGQDFDTRYMLTLTPLEVRNTPIVVFHDDTGFTDVTISLADTHFPHCIFPPSDPASLIAPVFLLHRGGHYTILKTASDADSKSYYEIVLSQLTAQTTMCHIPNITQDMAMPTIAYAIGLTSPCSELDSLRVAHSVLMQSMREKHSLDRPAPSVGQGESAAMDDDGVDLLVVPTSPLQASRARASDGSSPPKRDAGALDRPSPTKAALLSTPPRNGNTGLERTPRHPSGTPPTSPDDSLLPSSQSLSARTSQLSLDSLNSERDMGAYVDMHCGRNQSTYAARIGVLGQASSDETSQSGSLSQSSRSASLSQTPSMYSTGSLHEHLVPNGADVPLCKCRRKMGFFRFVEQNHACDNPECAKDIAKNAYGWHCADCSVDICSACFPYSWTPVDSFASSLPDSSGTLKLDSPSPDDSPVAASRHQEDANAAASGRGHNA
jgi:hypothetical protein